MPSPKERREPRQAGVAKAKKVCAVQFPSSFWVISRKGRHQNAILLASVETRRFQCLFVLSPVLASGSVEALDGDTYGAVVAGAAGAAVAGAGAGTSTVAHLDGFAGFSVVLIVCLMRLVGLCTSEAGDVVGQ
jgi:hypothetical protein